VTWDLADLVQQEARDLFELVTAALIAVPDGVDYSIEPVPAAASALAPAGGRLGWQIHLELQSKVLSNGSRPLDLLDDLRQLGGCFGIASINDMQLDQTELDDGFMTWDITLLSDCGRGAIDQVFVFARDEIKLDCVPLGTAKAAAPMPARTKASPPQTRRLGLHRTSGLTGFVRATRHEPNVVPTWSASGADTRARDRVRSASPC
jgi:hypothetical protein